MIGLIERKDSLGDLSYFTIIGVDKDSLFNQMSELNDNAYYCDTGNHFRLIGHKINGQWFDNCGKILDNHIIAKLIKEDGVI